MKESKTPLKNDRSVSLDFAKGIGVLLVVYAHTVYFEPILTIVYSFHMPLFFVISGILFNEKKYTSFSNFIIHRMKTILLPFIVFLCVSFCLTSVLSVISNGFSLELLFNYFITFGKLLFANNSEPFSIVHNEPLWFLPCLFLVECIYYFISKIKNKFIFCSVIATLYITGWILSNNAVHVFLPWNLCATLMAVSFYVIGHCARRRFFFVDSSEYLPKRITCVIISLISIAICILIALINGKISLGHNVVNNGILFFITGISGSVSVLSVSIIVKKSQTLISYLGRNSLSIMGIHMLIVSILHFLLQKFFSISNAIFEDKIEVAFLFFLLVLLISILFVFLINRIKFEFQKNS